MTGVSTTSILIAIACLVMATFASRAGLLLMGRRLTLSRRVETALRFAPACALAALVLPETLAPTGTLDLTLGNARWLAAIAAAAFLWWRAQVLEGIAVGMAVYTAIRLWHP